MQVLTALSKMDDINIVHAHFKPDNIMLVGTGRVKLIDLGCALHASQAGINTYIQTRFYRAPEILLGMTQEETFYLLMGTVTVSLLHSSFLSKEAASATTR